jgi:hypothetical protein
MAPARGEVLAYLRSRKHIAVLYYTYREKIVVGVFENYNFKYNTRPKGVFLLIFRKGKYSDIL